MFLNQASSTDSAAAAAAAAAWCRRLRLELRRAAGGVERVGQVGAGLAPANAQDGEGGGAATRGERAAHLLTGQG